MATVARYTIEEVQKAARAIARKFRAISEESYRDSAESDEDAESLRINLVEEGRRIVGVFEQGGDKVFEVASIALSDVTLPDPVFAIYIDSPEFSGFVPRDFSGLFDDLL